MSKINTTTMAATASARLAPLLAASVCLLLAGCGGGGIDVASTQLGGAVLISGDQLADLLNPAEIGAQDSAKWAVRVIDPTESVDAIELGHTDTLITPVYLPELPEYLVQIEFLAAVDLDGSGAAVSPVILDCAAQLSPAAVNTLSAAVEIIAPAGASSVRSTAAASGYQIRLRYQLAGPAPADELLELDWTNRQLRRDTNRNGQLDDETYFADSDRNCISDNRQQGLQDGAGSGMSSNASGALGQIDTDSGTLTVDGKTYFITETTVIVDVQGRSITLADLVPGNDVAVNGRRGRYGALYATRIEQLE